MKTHRALIIGFALVTAVAAQAQTLASRSTTENSRFRDRVVRVPDLKKATANYLVNLNSNIPGVVESALGHVTLMRIAYPKQEMEKIQARLYELASKGASKSIRQKAFISMQVFADPFAYKWAIADDQASGDGLLEALAARF